MRIGIVDVDTSHPQNWIPIERELGHEVVGLWDAGAVHPSWPRMTIRNRLARSASFSMRSSRFNSESGK